MGLLDFSGFVGDDTTKDEYGLTQADRRQPLWSGLFKAGMLGMAAGQDITQGQRANLMAQMGGAVGGIPEAMNQQRAEAAQMQLKRQQFTAGQQKLEQAAKLRAYAQTPEFAELIKGVPPHVKAGLDFAIQSGDADSVQRLLSSYQTAQTAQAETARKEARDDAKDVAKAAADAAKESGFGNTPYGINARNLRDAPIDSYAYWQAHQFFSAEQKAPDGSIIPKLPNMVDAEWKPGMPVGGTPGRTVGSPSIPGAPPAAGAPAAPAPAPAGGGPAPAPGAPAASGTPAAPAPAPAPVVIAPNAPVDAAVAAKVGGELESGQSRDVNGVLIEKDKGGNIVWNDGTDHYTLRPKGGAPERKPLIPPPEPQQKALETFNTGVSAIDRLVNELDTKKVALGPGAALIASFPYGNAALDASNPEGTTARLLIAGLTSAKIKETSGGTVTDAEFSRLDKYLPKEGDNEVVLRKKLANLKLELQAIGQNRLTTLPPETRLPPEWRQRFGKGGAKSEAAAGEKKWKIGDKWTDAAGQKWIVDPDGNWKTDQ